MREYIELTLRAQERGEEYPFAVVLRRGARVIGSTRFLRVQPADRGTDIGFTWYAPEFWGTFVNPECKYLMLRHAFEEWGAIRVALTTDVKNVHSAGAIRKLGARLEGILRNHRIRRDGSYRDTLIFSIIESEWPSVKSELEARLGSFAA
jgi:N-acetyltransferase